MKYFCNHLDIIGLGLDIFRVDGTRKVCFRKIAPNSVFVGELSRHFSNIYKYSDYGKVAHLSPRNGMLILLKFENQEAAFLPACVTDQYRAVLNYFQGGKFAVAYRGTVDVGKPIQAVSFEIVEI